MLNCVDIKSAEYQTLAKRAGVPAVILEAISRAFATLNGRLPHLDEIPNSNSEPALREFLEIGVHNGAKLSTLEEKLGTSDPKEMLAAINREFTDLEVSVSPIVEEAIITITHRPTTNNFKVEPIALDRTVNSAAVFTNMVYRLADIYGIQIIPTSDLKLNSEDWLKEHNIPLVSQMLAANAFVHNGNIYINVDKANVDAPVHEMMHILLGGFRFNDPDLYFQLVESAKLFEHYNELIQPFDGRTERDAMEEVFVQELAKYLTGMPSAITNLPENVKYEINYNVKRMLDTLIMGQESVKIVNDASVMQMSLAELAEWTNSRKFVNRASQTFFENSGVWRKLNNTKSQMMANHDLILECD